MELATVALYLPDGGDEEAFRRFARKALYRMRALASSHRRDTPVLVVAIQNPAGEFRARSFVEDEAFDIFEAIADAAFRITVAGTFADLVPQERYLALLQIQGVGILALTGSRLPSEQPPLSEQEARDTIAGYVVYEDLKQPRLID
jgi:hypothetical protein